MRKVHRPHVLVVDAVDGEVRKHASICELAPFEVDLPPHVFIVNVVLSPFLVPVGRLECHREGARHLHCVDDWQIRRSFVIEESQNVVRDVHRSAGKLDSSDVVQLFHCHFIFPVLEVLFIKAVKVFFHAFVKLLSYFHLI